MSHDVRASLALPLDVDDLDEAVRTARRFGEVYGVVKVGLELWAAAGPVAVTALRDEGFDVFCDLKLHDIPTQVGRAARVVARLGPRYVTFHAAGGLAMLRAGMAGLAAGAEEGGHPAPIGLGVTVLTSDPDGGDVAARLALARQGGCGGVVCSAHELARAAADAPGLVRVVPGIRTTGAASDDQARVATPAAAVTAGADVLVVGRAVTAAPDPDAAARALAEEVASARAATGAAAYTP